jgi:hypothetical protein
MKNSMLIFISIFFIGCTNIASVEGGVVTKVEILDEKNSMYTSNGDYNHVSHLFNSEKPRFKAKKGLYNVGDTIKFYK